MLVHRLRLRPSWVAPTKRHPEWGGNAEDLRPYVETKKWADELDEKIEKTNRLMDEIVYELYGLTDKEIEIVETEV